MELLRIARTRNLGLGLGLAGLVFTAFCEIQEIDELLRIARNRNRGLGLEGVVFLIQLGESLSVSNSRNKVLERPPVALGQKVATNNDTAAQQTDFRC